MLINKNLYGKSASSFELPIRFDETFKVTSVPFFIPDFNLLGCKLDNLHLKCYNESFYIGLKLKQNKFQ